MLHKGSVGKVSLGMGGSSREEDIDLHRAQCPRDDDSALIERHDLLPSASDGVELMIKADFFFKQARLVEKFSPFLSLLGKH